jgi:hypothetical protein
MYVTFYFHLYTFGNNVRHLNCVLTKNSSNEQALTPAAADMLVKVDQLGSGILHLGISDPNPEFFT